MQKRIVTSCPGCKTQVEIMTPYDPVRCTVCGTVFVAMEKPRDTHSEAEKIFLSGSSYLALGDYPTAAERFLDAAKLSPNEPKYWLYLLCAMTVRFTVLHPIADEKTTFLLEKRKVIYRSVYKNFTATAGKDDYIFASMEFGIDLTLDGEMLWTRILDEILAPDFPHPTKKAAQLADYATSRLDISHPQAARRYHEALARRLNPINDGVLEIHTLKYFPDAADGILRLDTAADTVEFSLSSTAGADRFSAFLLTKGIESIGGSFPFAELVADDGLTEIPSRLMCFCTGIERVRLSPTVKKIGKNAFSDCTGLHSISPLDNVTEIGDRAFFGTAIRTLDLPSGMKRLGREILGTKKGADTEIAKYLIELDAELAEKSEGFNTVGEHKCGLLTRKNGKVKMIYPEKYENGTKIPLTQNEKMIFRALACVSVEDNAEEKNPSLSDKLRQVTSSLLDKFKKK